MGPLFPKGTIQRVFMPSCHHIFWSNADLVRKWLHNAGHVVVTAAKDCDVQIAFLPKNVHVADPATTPTVLVSTEQPASPRWSEAGTPFLHAIQTFWCMDIVDAKFLHETYGIPYAKLCIVPVMAGTYVATLPAKRNPTSIDVLQFGEMNARRANLMSDIEALLPEHRVVVTENSWADVLTNLISTTRLVVVPHFWEEPVVFPVHRIMNVMQHPGVQVVAEDSISSVYMRLLLQQFGNRIAFVKYEDMASAVQERLQARSTDTMVGEMFNFMGEDTDITDVQPACIEKLFAWHGDSSWLNMLTPDAFDMSSL